MNSTNVALKCEEAWRGNTFEKARDKLKAQVFHVSEKVYRGALNQCVTENNVKNYQLLLVCLPMRLRRSRVLFPSVRRACERDLDECLRLALDCDYFDVNYSDPTQLVTAVHICAQNNSATCLQLLIDRNAMLDKQEKYNGNTPLHFAAQCNDYPRETITLLLENGANARVQNKKRKTPLKSTKTRSFHLFKHDIEKVRAGSVTGQEQGRVEIAGKEASQTTAADYEQNRQLQDSLNRHENELQAIRRELKMKDTLINNLDDMVKINRSKIETLENKNKSLSADIQAIKMADNEYSLLYGRSFLKEEHHARFTRIINNEDRILNHMKVECVIDYLFNENIIGKTFYDKLQAKDTTTDKIQSLLNWIKMSPKNLDNLTSALNETGQYRIAFIFEKD